MSRQREQFDAARKAMPLPELWSKYGYKLRQKGERFETAYTPCCGTATRGDAGSLFLKADGEWRFHCFRCKAGGSAIDFVAHEDGISLTEAAKKLIHAGGGFVAIAGRGPTPPTKRVTARERGAAMGAIIKAIAARQVIDPIVRDYLVKQRQIPRKVVEEAHARGLLHTLPGNADAADVWLRLNVEADTMARSGVQRKGARRSAAAYRPLVFLPPGGECCEFVSIVGGEPKALQYGDQEYPLVWKPRGQVTKVCVVEGGIDLLSVVALGFSQDTLIIGLLGASAWRPQWIEQINARYPGATWLVALDNDQGGDASSDRMIEEITAAGLPAMRLRPWGGGNDWNDALKAASF